MRTALPVLVVLDLAGTTVEDRGQVPDAFFAALTTHGLAASGAQVDALRGSSKRAAIAALVPPGSDHAQRAADVFASFLRELHARYAATGVRPVPGAIETLSWLRARDVRIALNTGFDRATTDLLLDRLAWREGMADAIVCGDDVEQGRPAPDLIRKAMHATGTRTPAQVANVGDTALDLRAGHAAGVGWNVGVLSGAHDRARLEAEPHTHIVGSVADLPALFEVTR